MIELGAQPRIPRCMTRLAGGREAQLLMVGHGILILHLMAGIAIGGQSLELADGQALVAGIALHRRVRTDQGEAVLVLLDGGQGYAPASDRVALLAGGAELPPMDVRVAVGAPRPHVAEDQVGVTLHTAQVGVTAA